MHTATPSKRTRTENESQRSDSQFSTDLSQENDHQQPVTSREAWIHLQPRNKKEKRFRALPLPHLQKREKVPMHMHMRMMY